MVGSQQANGLMDAVASVANATTMRAATQDRYGPPDVLEVRSLPRPEPADDEVIIRVRAASVCRGDVHIITGRPSPVRLMGYGLTRPRHPVPGQNVAGTVAAAGREVSGFAVGDEVFGAAVRGGFAEYVAVPSGRVAAKPAAVTFAQAATLPVSGQTALQAIRDVGRMNAGDAVLINGAAGGVGSFAVQIAKARGGRVTAVCAPRAVETMIAIGADHVIDYTRSDFVRESGRHDLLLDLVGNRTLTELESVLTPDGVLVSSAGGPIGARFGPMLRLLQLPLRNMVSRRTLRSFLMESRASDLVALARLVASGDVKPVIEAEHALDDVVDAVRHVARGHSLGTTVLEVANPTR